MANQFSLFRPDFALQLCETMVSVANLLASPLDKLSLVNTIGSQTSDLTLLFRVSILPIIGVVPILKMDSMISTKEVTSAVVYEASQDWDSIVGLVVEVALDFVGRLSQKVSSGDSTNV